MAETDIGCIDVLPRPILSRELAIHGIERGDVLTPVIMQSPIVAHVAHGATDLYRLQDFTIEKVDALMGGNKDANVLFIESA